MVESAQYAVPDDSQNRSRVVEEEPKTAEGAKSLEGDRRDEPDHGARERVQEAAAAARGRPSLCEDDETTDGGGDEVELAEHREFPAEEATGDGVHEEARVGVRGLVE